MDLKRVNWNLYKYFVTVFETRNFHRAADILDVSPSAVSQAIKELGNQLNVVLFNAHRQGVEPTEEATKFYAEIKTAINTIISAEEGISGFDADSEGTINACVHGWVASNYVSKYLKEFSAKYPKIKITITQNEDVELLKSSKVDFMIDGDVLFNDGGFKIIDIFKKDVHGHFVMSKSYMKTHGLNNPISKVELLKHPIIERDQTWEAYKKLLDADFNPHEIKTTSADQILAMVKNDIGFGLFGSYMLKDLIQNYDIVDLQLSDMKLPSVRFVVAYKKLSRHAQAFVDGLVAFCRNNVWE